MGNVGIVSNIGHYTNTVHFTDCSYYKSAQYRHPEAKVLRTGKWRFCSSCSPTIADLLPIAADLEWSEDTGSRDAWTNTLLLGDEELVDDLSFRRSSGARVSSFSVDADEYARW